MAQPFAMPAGACDTHFHVILAHEGAVLPGDRASEDHRTATLLQRQSTDGLTRGVVVQTRRQSHDDLVAILSQSAGRWRGLALPGDLPEPGALRHLHAAGIRGMRFSFVKFMGRPPPAEHTIRRWADAVWPLGWHLDFHVEAPDLVEHAALFKRLDGPIVIDHLAHTRVDEGPGHAGFDMLLDMLGNGHTWLKLSGMDRWSRAGAPTYADAIPIGRAAVKAAPHRVIWASDSPYVMYRDPYRPDGAAPPRTIDLLGLLAGYCGTQEIWRQVLVDNPARLFGFAT